MERLQLPPPPNALEANAGGKLRPDQVIGRDLLIRGAWRTLHKRSLVFVAPRRSGKTSVCDRMVAYAPAEARTFWSSLEGNSRAVELVRELHASVWDLLDVEYRLKTDLHRLAVRFFGQVEITGLKIELKEADWRSWLSEVFAELQRWAQQHERLVVLFWDEFPSFIENMITAKHPLEAMAMLDQLRAVRAEHDRIRMVYNGSIGLDEVIGSLRPHGYTGEPINDMKKELVDVLDPPEALVLSKALLQGTKGDAPNDLATSVAILCEGHPFLIQNVIEGMGRSNEWNPNAADEHFERYLESADDPFELAHYIDRLAFRTKEPEIARTVLDAIARSDDGLTIDQLMGATGADDRTKLAEVTGELRRDRYLVRAKGIFRFARNYLLRYWKLERGL